jgi:Nif-specific regulatory protein
MVKEGRFREDLYYRLNVFPIVIPPLRERNSDIIALAEFFVSRFSKKFSKSINGISIPVQEMLLSYPWPGNVRELENVIERALIIAEGDVIHGYDLPLSLQKTAVSGSSTQQGLGAKVNSVEYEMIIEALCDHKGNISAAAETLGLTRRTLSLKMQKLGINYKKYR